MRGGLVLGLGGTGLRVAARVRQVLLSGGAGRVPDTIRLLAFDVRKPAAATAKLPQSQQFLVEIPPLEASSLPPRRAARQALLQDLALGAASSLALRGIAAQLEALRRAGADSLEAFLVCSTFGGTGSAWLLDMAYLLRHLTHNRLALHVHAVLLTPSAFERAFFPSAAQQLTSDAVLTELNALQLREDWAAGVSIYGGKYIGGLPGRLSAPPFDSLQVLDGADLNTSPEAASLPAAAEGILCQLDPAFTSFWDEPPRPALHRAGAFSTFGVSSLAYPSRLVLEGAIQRLLLGAVDHLFPLAKNADTGRPEHLAEPSHPRPDDPYGKLEAWLPAERIPGLLEDALRVAAALAEPSTGPHLEFKEQLAARSPSGWAALFGRCPGFEASKLDPSALRPAMECHLRAFLQALGWRLSTPDPRLGAPLEYLQKLERALSAYLQDLDWAVEEWRRKGEHSESEDLRRTLAEARKEAVARTTSLLGRLVPASAQEAHARFEAARQTHARYRQREAYVAAAVQAAALMRVITHRLLLFSQRALRALALEPGSVYNTALDQSARIERDLRFEAAVRSQQLVIDQGFETRQSHLVFDEFTRRLAGAIASGVESIAEAVDWQTGDARLPFRVTDPARESESVLLDDPDLPIDRLAGVLTRALSFHFAESLLHSRPENSVLNFLSYLDPQAPRLAARLTSGCTQQARLLHAVAPRRSLLFMPRGSSTSGSAYAQALIGELYAQIGQLQVYQTANPDRLTLFHFYAGLELENLLAFQQGAPGADLTEYTLWNL